MLSPGPAPVLLVPLAYPWWLRWRRWTRRLALLNHPSGVAVDAAGNLYIADTINHRIRRVDASTWKISTIAGTGSKRFRGDGGTGTRGRTEVSVSYRGGCIRQGILQRFRL